MLFKKRKHPIKRCSNVHPEGVDRSGEPPLNLWSYVHSEGFEPSTPRAEIWYSIQLNYECKIRMQI